MFEGLSHKIDAVLSSLKGKAIISNESFKIAMGTVRSALLDADVSLDVVKQFLKEVEDKIVGQRIMKKISPSKFIIKIFEDEIAKLLGEIEEEKEKEKETPDKPIAKKLLKNLKFTSTPPSVIMMVGLQGCGKTTTSAKLAYLLKQARKPVMLASLDTNRPAAREQLATLGKQIGVSCLPITETAKDPIELAKKSLECAADEGYDILILDTAGRLQIDTALMQELKAIKQVANPSEVLLVADALIGQEAIEIAKAFDDVLGISGIILTRVDADSRGGAALSMRYATGKQIKFMGSGEKVEDLDAFDPRRIARRILGMGDVVSLVEKAYQVIGEEETKKASKKAELGKFDFDDLKTQLETLNKLGGIAGVMKFIPGLGSMQMRSNINDSVVKHHVAIINSMTKKERKNPSLILNNSRKARIIEGSGTDVSHFNLLINQFKQASKMIKHIKNVGLDKLKDQNIMDMFSNKKKK